MKQIKELITPEGSANAMQARDQMAVPDVRLRLPAGVGPFAGD